MAERGEGLRANRAASRALTGRIAQLKESAQVSNERAAAVKPSAGERTPSRNEPAEVVEFKTDAPETELVEPEKAAEMSASSITPQHDSEVNEAAIGDTSDKPKPVKKAAAKKTAAKKTTAKK